MCALYDCKDIMSFTTINIPCYPGIRFPLYQVPMAVPEGG